MAKKNKKKDKKKKGNATPGGFSEVPFDSSSFTPDQLGGIGSQAHSTLQEVKAGWRGRSGIPVSFLDEGTTKFRIWPDRDSEGRVRLLKAAYIHNLDVGTLDEPNRIRCWRDERINKLADKAKDSGFAKHWKWRSRTQGYVMARVLECPQSDYLKPDMDVVLVLSRKQMEALLHWISTLDRDELTEFDPNKRGLPVLMSLSGSGKDQQVNVRFGRTQVPMPSTMELPEEAEWEGLDEVYISESNRISDEDFAAFEKHAMAIINRRAA